MTMPDLAFYNAGTEEPRGLKRAIILPRRLLRRLLRPVFLRLVVILQHLAGRLDAAETADLQLRHEVERLARQQAALAENAQTAIALGWDHVALARRLAVLEDRVEALADRAEADPPGAAPAGTAAA